MTKRGFSNGRSNPDNMLPYLPMDTIKFPFAFRSWICSRSRKHRRDNGQHIWRKWKRSNNLRAWTVFRCTRTRHFADPWLPDWLGLLFIGRGTRHCYMLWVVQITSGIVDSWTKCSALRKTLNWQVFSLKALSVKPVTTVRLHGWSLVVSVIITAA